MCVCVCACVKTQAEREMGREIACYNVNRDTMRERKSIYNISRKREIVL